MAKRVAGILFDLGDTLLDFGKLDIRSLFEAGARKAYAYLADLGQPLPPFSRFHRQQFWAIRWNYLKSRLTRREFNALDVLGKLSMRMGHDLSRQQTVELAWQWYEPLGRCATLEEGAVELLKEFRADGLTLGLISNTFVPGQVLDRHLESLGLLELLPVRVYSCDVLFRKPNHNIFAVALQQAGLKPHQTIFVGDLPKADIEGANRSGMISVLKDATGRHDHSSIRPAHRIRQLADLREIVNYYNKPQDTSGEDKSP